jgi:hypothetical protein
MQTQVHPLEPYFRQAIRNSYENKLGLFDPEVSAYVARVLCEFTNPENLYRIRDAAGRPIQDLEEMIKASDPVHGSARSFDAERSIRKHIGNFTLFMAGMYPEAIDAGRYSRPLHLGDLIQAGKASFYIVSQFNLFEYEEEAPLFARLSESFERCTLGLTLARDEMGEHLPPMPHSPRL